MIARLNRQIVELKHTLNQFQDDVQARSQRRRNNFPFRFTLCGLTCAELLTCVFICV